MARALRLGRRIEHAVGVIMAHCMIEKAWKKERSVERYENDKKEESQDLNPGLALEVATNFNVVRRAK